MTAPTIEEMTPRKLFDIGEDDRLPTNVRREVIAAAAIWASALEQLEAARKAIPEEQSGSNAPADMDNSEASCWATGFNRCLDMWRSALPPAPEAKP